MSNRRVRQARKEVDDAQAQELTRIYHKFGALTASNVMNEARADSSPIHNKFEWDDAKAGHEYRLDQARKLIRLHFVIMGTGERERLIHVPPTAAVREQHDSREGEYHPVSVVVQDVSMFQRALGALNAKLRAAEQACDELRLAAEHSGDATQMQMAQINAAMLALKTASDVVRSLH